MTVASFSPHATTVAGTGGDGKIWSWDLPARQPHQIASLPAPIHAAAHAPDGRLAVADENGHGLILPSTTPASTSPQITFTMDRRGPDNLAFSPNGSLLAAASRDYDILRGLPSQLTLWDAHTGHLLASLDLPRELPAFTGFTPDGRSLLLVTADDGDAPNPGPADHGYLRIWPVADLLAGRSTPRQKVALTGDQPLDAALDPTGHLLAVGGYDKKIDLWDPVTGRHVKTLATLPGTIRSLVFSPDGALIATGTSVDGVLRLYDTRTGDPWAALTGVAAVPNRLAFSPDGALLALASTDGTLDLWPLSPATAAATICQALANPSLPAEWQALRPAPATPPCS
jgi:WD40 repeat protein